MHRPYVRLVLALLAASVLSFLAGVVFMETVGAIPCEGEGLACNIDAAVGGYGVVIFAVLGPIIYGVTLLVAENRAAVIGAARRSARADHRLLPARHVRRLALYRLRRL